MTGDLQGALAAVVGLAMIAAALCAIAIGDRWFAAAFAGLAALLLARAGGGDQ